MWINIIKHKLRNPATSTTTCLRTIKKQPLENTHISTKNTYTTTQTLTEELNLKKK